MLLSDRCANLGNAEKWGDLRMLQLVDLIEYLRKEDKMMNFRDRFLTGLRKAQRQTTVYAGRMGGPTEH